MQLNDKILSRIAILILILSFVFPLSALIGWTTDIWLIGALAPQSIPMAPLTAIILTSVSGVLLVKQLNPMSSRVAIFQRGVACLAIFISGFVFCVHVFDLSADVEHFLSAAVPFDSNVVAGRMSPLTAFNIMLDSTALLLLALPRRATKFSGYFAAVSLIICSTTLLGYIYGTPLLYGGKTIPMALGTALTLLFIDLSLLLSCEKNDFPKNLFFGVDIQAQLIRAFVPAIILAILGSSFVLALFSLTWNINPALSAVATSIVSVILSVFVIVRVSQGLNEKLQRVDSLEASLELSTRKFGAFLKNGPFASFVRDQHGAMLFGNSISSTVFSDPNLLPQGIREHLYANGKVEHDIEIKLPDESTSYWHIIHFLIQSEKNETLVAGIGIDISKIKAAEEEREKVQKQLKLSYKMAALGEMSGSIAHEINNPIAIILGKSRQINELLNEQPIDTQLVKKFAVAIDETSRRISSVVHGLRTISRQSHKDSFISASVMNIIDGTVAISTGRFREKNVLLKIDPCHEGTTVDCQPAQIAQVILNLLNNAFDAVEDLKEKWVHLSATSDKTHVIIRVADSGNMVPNEIRSQMFKPFFTTKAVGKGTGLGLSISTSIIQAHGGSLTLDDSLPHTCFEIRLPIKKTTKLSDE